MTPNDVANTQPAPATAPAPQPPHRDEIRKASFWVSQIFILAATVMGVYLASSQGFKQAMTYGEIMADKDNYYLRKSLQSEIADNLALVRDYMKRLETGGMPARQAPFALDTFVWENMKFSSATLETPPELLRESRLFYRGVADLQQKIANNTYGVKVGIEKLQELVDHVEKDVLPRFSADCAALKAALAKRDYRVD